MDAPRPSPSDNRMPELQALANLGRSPDFKQAQIVKHAYGYAIKQSNSSSTEAIDFDTIKEAISQLPQLIAEGRIDESFYNNVRAGIEKLQFSHPHEKSAMQFLARQVSHIANKALWSKEENLKQVMTSPPAPAEIPDITGRVGLEVKVLTTAQSIPLANLTPLQKAAEKELNKLIAPQFQKIVMADLRNLHFIQSPDDLDKFKNYIQGLIKLRNATAIELRKNRWDIDEKLKDEVGALVGPNDMAIIDKEGTIYTIDQMRYFISKIDNSLFEQGAIRNHQIVADVFADPVTPKDRNGTERRRLITIAGNKLKLADQLQRESKNQPAQLGDYNPDQKILVQQDYNQRISSSYLWEKCTWNITHQVPQENDRNIFIAGTLQLSVAAEGQKPISASVDFNLEELGDLTYEQSAEVLTFLKNYIFPDKQPAKYPENLEFLKYRIVKRESDKYLEADGTVNQRVTTAKDELLKMAKIKKEEVKLMEAKTYFRAMHPDIPI